MTVLADRLARPNVKDIALLEVTAGKHVTFWTLATGYAKTYYSDLAGSAAVDVYGLIEDPGEAGGLFGTGEEGIPAASFAVPQSIPKIVGVKENGVALGERSSIDNVEAEAGTWFYWKVIGRLCVHPTSSGSPYGKTIQATVFFPFSTISRVINGMYYEGRIRSLPTLSMRVEKSFGDPGQIGSGNVTLANEDGFFDSLTGLQWDAGQSVLKFGVDEIALAEQLPQGGDGVLAEAGGILGYDTGGIVGVGETLVAVADLVYRDCDYADFETLGTWRNKGWDKSDEDFTLELEEKKGALKKKIPTVSYDRATYPNIADPDIGRVIPIVFGTIYDVAPVCIDTAARTFKVAGHAIKEFLGCRVKKLVPGDLVDAENESWVDVNFETVDEGNGEFTLAADDWEGSQEVAVDFRGRMNADGTLMTNASDVVRDLVVTWLGEPESLIDADSFDASWEVYNVGYDADGWPVTHLGIALCIDEEEDATDIVARINSTVGAYFFNGFDGKYHFVAFDPIPGDSVLSFDESEIEELSENVDATEMISSVKAQYQHRAVQDYPQTTVYERPEAQYLQGANAPVVKVLELPVDTLSDARYVAERTARMDGERLRTFDARLSHKAWEKKCAHFIRLSSSRHDIDAVFEVLEVRRNLANTMWIDVVLGNLHGLGDGILFATADTPTFPARLGSGDASTWDDDWSDAQKAWARQNVGYVTDDNGFASATDPDSYMAAITV